MSEEGDNESFVEWGNMIFSLEEKRTSCCGLIEKYKKCMFYETVLHVEEREIYFCCPEARKRIAIPRHKIINAYIANSDKLMNFFKGIILLILITLFGAIAVSSAETSGGGEYGSFIFVLYIIPLYYILSPLFESNLLTLRYRKGTEEESELHIYPQNEPDRYEVFAYVFACYLRMTADEQHRLHVLSHLENDEIIEKVTQTANYEIPI